MSIHALIDDYILMHLQAVFSGLRGGGGIQMTVREQGVLGK